MKWSTQKRCLKRFLAKSTLLVIKAKCDEPIIVVSGHCWNKGCCNLCNDLHTYISQTTITIALKLCKSQLLRRPKFSWSNIYHLPGHLIFLQTQNNVDQQVIEPSVCMYRKALFSFYRNFYTALSSQGTDQGWYMWADSSPGSVRDLAELSTPMVTQTGPQVHAFQHTVFPWCCIVLCGGQQALSIIFNANYNFVCWVQFGKIVIIANAIQIQQYEVYYQLFIS